MLCPGCLQGELAVFARIGPVPVHCNLLFADRERALQVARDVIELGFCSECGLIHNVRFDPNLITYSEAYENSLHFSPRFQEYADRLVSRLVDRYGLHGKQIIEIGCGKGEFLRMLCSAGQSRGRGFDPSYAGDDLAGAGDGQISITRDLFSSRYADVAADLICCRHTLEHVQEPHIFLRQIRANVSNNAAIYFEVPNALYTFQDEGVWDIIYEHCSYFTAPSLASLFQRTGFSVTNLYPDFDEQFLCLDGHADAAMPWARPGHADLQELREQVWSFGRLLRAKLDEWDVRVSRWLTDGKRVVVWGGGSKGVTFLNLVDASRGIDYVVDINPRKQGMYISGTGQRLVGPEHLLEYRPDVVIVMNPVYRDETRGMLARMGVLAEVTTA